MPPGPSHTRALPLLLCALLAATPAARAAGLASYVLDPVHTRVQFAVEHAGFSWALGTVSGTTGILRFDRDDWTTASLEADVPLARLDLGDEAWNRATIARNLLDAERHPVARFVSTCVEPLSPDHARVHGQLQLRGVTRDVVLDVRLNALKRHPLPPFRRTAGFSATATLSRADFGISAWQSMIGDRVEVRIEAEATRAAGGDDSPDEGDAAATGATGRIPVPGPGEAATVLAAGDGRCR
jgi:polyisoprenoid-binding protein YceI